MSSDGGYSQLCMCGANVGRRLMMGDEGDLDIHMGGMGRSTYDFSVLSSSERKFMLFPALLGLMLSPKASVCTMDIPNLRGGRWTKHNDNANKR